MWGHMSPSLNKNRVLQVQFHALSQQVSLPFPPLFFTESAAIFVYDSYLWIVLSHPKHQWAIHTKLWPTSQTFFPAKVHDTGIYWKIPLPHHSVFSEYNKSTLETSPSIAHLTQRDLLDKFLHCTPHALYLSKKKAPYPPVILKHKGLPLHIFTTYHPRGGHYTTKNLVFFSILASLQGWVIQGTTPTPLLPWKTNAHHWILPYTHPLSSQKDRQDALNHQVADPSQDTFWKTLWSLPMAPMTDTSKAFMSLPTYISLILHHLSHTQGPEATHMIDLAFQQFPALKTDSYAQLLHGIALYLQGHYAKALAIFLRQDLPPERHFWYGLCLIKFPTTLKQGWDILYSTFHILQRYPVSLQIFLGQNIIHLALDFHHQALALNVLKILHTLKKNVIQQETYRTLQERYVHHISSFSLDTAIGQAEPELFSPKVQQYLEKIVTYNLTKIPLDTLKHMVTQLLLIRNTWKKTPLEAQATYCLGRVYDHLKEYPKALEMWHNWQRIPLKRRPLWPHTQPHIFQDIAADSLKNFLEGAALPQEKIRIWRKYHAFDTFPSAAKEKILTLLIEAAQFRYFYDQLFPLIVRTVSLTKHVPLLWIRTLVNLYHKKGHYHQALLFLENIKTQHPSGPEEISILRAKSWLKLKRPQDALKVLETTSSIPGRTLYLHILLAQKRWKDIEHYGDKILKTTLHPPWVIYRIIAALYQEKWQDIPTLRKNYFSFMTASSHKEMFLALTYHFDHIESIYDLQHRLHTWAHLRKKILSFYNNIDQSLV